MPGIFYEPLSRKEFCKFVAGAAGAVLLIPASQSRAEDAGSLDSVRVALLSDTHIPADPTNEYRGFRPVENLKQVVPQVTQAAPDFALIDGDAARLTGENGDYRALRELLSPIAARLPVCIGLGNHDNRVNFFRALPPSERQESAVNGKHVVVIEQAGMRFIVLDSLLYVNKVAGLLGKAQRTWLAEYLETADDRPTALFVHHTLGDGDTDLLDVDRLFRIIEPHRQVKAIFYGHSHRYAVDRRDHVQLVNLPAVGYNFNDREPVGWVDARFSRSGVAMTLHAIGGNEDEDGETRVVEWL